MLKTRRTSLRQFELRRHAEKTLTTIVQTCEFRGHATFHKDKPTSAYQRENGEAQDIRREGRRITRPATAARRRKKPVAQPLKGQGPRKNWSCSGTVDPRGPGYFRQGTKLDQVGRLT